MTRDEELSFRIEFENLMEENLTLTEISQLMWDSLARIALSQVEDPAVDAVQTIRGVQMIVPTEKLGR